ncbi:hypothetical protein JCM8097_003462 [Rhodosporidiobolus ruineniae]
MLPSPSSTFSPVYIATYAELATVLADSALVLWILSCFVSTLVVLLTFAHGPSIRGMKRSRQVLAVAVFLANACGLVAATVTFASLPLALYEALGVPPLLLYFVATQSGVCLLCIFAYAAFYGAIAVMRYLPSAAQALRIPLLHEHLRRKSYPDTALDLTLLFLHRLSGFFIQTFLPFPSLRSLYHPVNSHLLLAVLFTPLFAYDTHPDDWPSSAGRDDPGITRSLRTLLNVAVRCIASLVDGVGTATPLSEVDAAAYVERVLDEAAAGRYAAEAEKRAHEAILDAVLGWAAVREGR